MSEPLTREDVGFEPFTVDSLRELQHISLPRTLECDELIDRLATQLLATMDQRDTAIRSREGTHQFYAVRDERLKEYAKEKGFWHDLAAIWANAKVDISEQPTYDQQMNLLRYRAERAEAERDTLRRRVERLEGVVEAARRLSRNLNRAQVSSLTRPLADDLEDAIATLDEEQR